MFGTQHEIVLIDKLNKSRHIYLVDNLNKYRSECDIFLKTTKHFTPVRMLTTLTKTHLPPRVVTIATGEFKLTVAMLDSNFKI